MYKNPNRYIVSTNGEIKTINKCTIVPLWFILIFINFANENDNANEISYMLKTSNMKTNLNYEMSLDVQYEMLFNTFLLSLLLFIMFNYKNALIFSSFKPALYVQPKMNYSIVV
jgi:hypothetical protein